MTATTTTATTAAGREFKISNWRPMQKNTLRGFVDIETPSGIILRGCSLHQKSGAKWVSMPSRQFPKSDGTAAWAPIVEFRDRSTADRFRDAALAALERAGVTL